jgi:hypothetical protein
MSKPTLPTYKTTNWADYNAALKRRGSLTIWFDPEMNWGAEPSGTIARNDALRASRYLGRTLWRNWGGYHRRSRVETKMHCVKLLGQRLMARDFDRHVAEVQVRVAILNGYTTLGIPVTKAVG